MTEDSSRPARVLWTAVMLSVALLVLAGNWMASRTAPRRQSQPPPTLLAHDLSYRIHLALSRTGGVTEQPGYAAGLGPQKGFEDQAINGYEEVAREFPNDAASRLRLGVTSGKKEQPKYAREHLERARQLDKARAPLYDALLLVYATEKPPPAALLKARPALEAAPAWLRDTILPDVYEKAGDAKAADAARRAAAQRSEVFLAKLGFLGGGTLLLLLAGTVLLGLWALSHAGRAGETRAAGHSFPQWALLDFVEAFALWLFASTVFGLLAGAISGSRPGVTPRPEAQMLLMIVAYIPPGLLILMLLQLRAAERRMPFPEALGWIGRPWTKRLSWGLAGYAAAVPLTVVAALVAQRFIPVDPFSTNPAIPVIVSAESVWSRIGLLALVAVVAPIVEETLFRGVAYGALRARWGMGPAIVVSAGVFAAMHHSLALFLPLFTLGAVFAYLYESTGSILPCMVAHACQNGLTTVALWVLATV